MSIPSVTPRRVIFTVTGAPASQGSMRSVPVQKRRKDGRAYTGVRTFHDNPKALKAWREAVAWSALAAGARLIPAGTSVGVWIVFRLPLEGKQKDLDKLARAVLDALKGFAYEDDRQVAQLNLRRAWAPYGTAPGATVTVEELEGD